MTRNAKHGCGKHTGKKADARRKHGVSEAFILDTSIGCISVEFDRDRVVRVLPGTRLRGAKEVRAAGEVSKGRGRVLRAIFGRLAAKSRERDAQRWVEAAADAAGVQRGSFTFDVWAAIARIPRGEVRTYGDIAREIGRRNAARAVGNACGKNPLPILVPCHRVVASSGIGGYGLPIGIKKRLLILEGCRCFE